MSIKNRIVLLVSGLLLFALIVMVAGLVQMKANNATLDTLYDDRVVPLETLKKVADDYAVYIVDANHKLRNGNITPQQADQDITRVRAEIRDLWSAYMATTLTPKEAELAKQAQNLMRQADSAIDDLQRMIKAQDMQGITQFSIHRLYPAIDPITAVMSELVNLQLDVAAEINQAAEAQYNTFFWLAIGVFGLVFVLAIYLSYLTLRAITLPLNELVKVSTHVQKNGDLSARVGVKNMDEVGLAAASFNDLMDTMSGAIRGVNRVVGAIAQSDYSQRMTRDYPGDFDKLKQGVNESANQVAFMMGELAKVMQGLHQGRFDMKMDNRVPKAFSDQVDSALASINAVIEDIDRVMSHMNAGQFSYRVQADAQGKLLEMKNNVNQSMDSLETAIQEITEVVVAQSKGDLTFKTQREYYGSLQTLTHAVNQTADRLVEVVSKAVEASAIVNSASDEVSKGALDLSQRVQEQAAALEQTSATMDQMNTAVQNNTQNAKQATQVAREVEGQANQGSKVMQQTIEAMNAIQESSHKISDIVSLIDGIAFQTNLLALNAAVEAARAGEHGRGFAVVAGEVRALAQKSAEAAKEISALIGESVNRIDQGTKLADESGKMLGAITGSIKDVTQMIAQIAQASQEQAEGVNQVHKAITSIDQVTQQNAALVEETSAAAESMSEQAKVLSADMAFFKTGQQPGASSLRQAPIGLTQTVNKKAALKTTKTAGLPSPKSARMETSDEWSEF
ncbi:MCP four helix bundle domain-containing protein [Thiomicrospira microaerophila]|uniref:HAMP domain-containing methyl-accepting chemotaxis protein n=1 Tax=Thiomicrospira microaerophila TaxID=406020 RepID=UPI00201075DE|nr:methyl-accepting chemotaxis protein [Thiomicrospira microaerophila]UQB42475.1 MCP four helix bundle domain-containing protein [Thiomicrospira microaerophila]